jgi:hypothetical protein
LHLADGTSEALEAIREAEALAERFEGRWWSAELHRLRGVFLAEMGAHETLVKASFGEAIRTANRQKSVSLATRAEASELRRIPRPKRDPLGRRLSLARRAELRLNAVCAIHFQIVPEMGASSFNPVVG